MVALLSLALSSGGCAVAPASLRGGYDRDAGAYVGGTGQPNGNPAKWRGFSQTGEISFYAHSFEGKTTSSGETYRGGELTAAHRELPFGTRVKVTLAGSGKSVVVKVNDRGPFAKGRIMDVSSAAAKRLGMVEKGVAKARIEVIPE